MNINIRHFFGRNIRYKIISVICAIMVWFWVTDQTESFSFLGTKTVPVQVELRDIPANLVILNELPVVRVDVSGQNRDKDIHAYIDLKNPAIGEASYTIEVEPVDGMTVKKISPQSLPLNIDKLSDKPMPIQVRVTGKPASGYAAGDPILTPGEVVVRGPQGTIDKMEKVVVDINIDGANSTLRTSRPIFAPNPELNELKGVTALTGAVDVIVPIYDADSIRRVVPLSISIDGTVADGYELLSSELLPAAVTLIGPKQALAEISDLHLGTLSVEDLKSSRVFDIDPEDLPLPEKVIVALGTKIKVLVGVRKGQVRSK